MATLLLQFLTVVATSFIATCHCGIPRMSPGIADISNVDLAMSGFDPFLANPNLDPDPASRGNIFEPLSPSSDGRVQMSPFITKVVQKQRCTQNFIVESLENYSQYIQWKLGRYTMRAENNTEMYAMLRIGAEKNEVNNNIRTFFRKTDGVIIAITVNCITHVIEIGDYFTPAFTESFHQGVMILHHAARDEGSLNSINAYAKFVGTYGTQYAKKSHLGLRMTFEKRYTTKSKNRITKSQLKQCVLTAAKSSLDSGNQAATEANFSKYLEICSVQGGEYFVKSGMPSEKVEMLGSLRGGEDEILSAAQISLELKPISSLFSDVPVSRSDTYIKHINVTSTTDFFDKLTSNYCELVLGGNCPTFETTGCGINSECTAEEKCADDTSSPLGYRCEEYTVPCQPAFSNTTAGCLYLSSDTMSWDDANAHCAEQEAQLYIAETSQQLNDVSTVLHTGKIGTGSAYVALKLQSGQWIWSTGRLQDMTKDWITGEPDDGDNCGYLYSGDSYHLAGRPCSYKMKSLCQVL